MNPRFYKLASLLLIVAACGVTAFGQGTSASITGIVVDQSGAIIPGADIKAKNNATATPSTT
jgi:hypothetical protein